MIFDIVSVWSQFVQSPDVAYSPSGYDVTDDARKRFWEKNETINTIKRIHIVYALPCRQIGQEHILKIDYALGANFVFNKLLCPVFYTTHTHVLTSVKPITAWLITVSRNPISSKHIPDLRNQFTLRFLKFSPSSLSILSEIAFSQGFPKVELVCHLDARWPRQFQVDHPRFC